MRIRRPVALIAVAAVAVAIGAVVVSSITACCAHDRSSAAARPVSTTPEAPRPLQGTTWVLGTVVVGDVASPVTAGLRRPTLTIDGDVALIDTGCNRGRATVSIGDGQLTFGPAATTRMACDEPSMLLERRVLDVVSATTVTAAIHGDLLTLTTGTASLVYRAAT